MLNSVQPIWNPMERGGGSAILEALNESMKVVVKEALAKRRLITGIEIATGWLSRVAWIRS